MVFRRFSLCLAAFVLAALGCSVVFSKDLPQALSLPDAATGSPQGKALSLEAFRQRITNRLQPATQATRELQSGYQKLNRVCAIGKSPPPALTPSLPQMSGLTARARSQLNSTELALQQVLADFTQNSRLTRLSACRYVPSFVPLSFTCEGFRQDSARLDTAKEAIQKLVGEAHQRLDLYEQFAQLELQGCTRPGFSWRLWETEQVYLWPTVTDSPVFFRALLSDKSMD
jgi:hypothetical protein